MTLIQMILCAVFGYLVGGFSTAITLSVYRKKQDVRQMGSGNAGATNMLRSFGWHAGLTTFIGDVCKGAFATAMGLWAFGPDGAVICGVAAVVGHTFPLYYGFKGGKGVSATIGMMIVLAPLVMLGVGVIIIAVIYFSRIVSLGSMIGNILLTAAMWIFYPERLSLCIGMTCLLVLNLFSHRKNIIRLLHGNENKMNWRELSAASRVEIKVKDDLSGQDAS